MAFVKKHCLEGRGLGRRMWGVWVGCFVIKFGWDMDVMESRS